MENFEAIILADRRINIREYPNAERFLAIDGPRGKRLADLGLHRRDLKFAEGSLTAINDVSDLTIRKALWFAAVCHLMKCFGDHESRFSLSPNKVYNNHRDALECFEFFKNLRNKHLIHDENSYMQGIPCAVLNKREAAYKIEKITSVTAVASTLEQNNYSNLHKLITDAIAYVEADFEGLCISLTAELESKDYDDLLAMSEARYADVELSSIGTNRR